MNIILNFCVIICFSKHCTFTVTHRPLCKDQAFRSERQADWKKEEDVCKDGKLESLLQRVFCLPCGTGTTKGKLSPYNLLSLLSVLLHLKGSP